MQKTFEHFEQSLGGTPVDGVGNRQGKGRVCVSFGSGSQGVGRMGVLLF